ncbi:hypothetical protein AAFP30_04645 [Gordonia sp. CPCC 205515]|uniref:hypothetical protein n=1 Tax=Gordonia sp. CPCC 205515 TaxID=3140791 RepID=UPI003AF36799
MSMPNEVRATAVGITGTEAAREEREPLLAGTSGGIYIAASLILGIMALAVTLGTMLPV